MNTPSSISNEPYLFLVDDDGSISDPSFIAKTSREELYRSIASTWADSARDLALEMSSCPPLAWRVHRLYEDARDDISEALSDLDKDSEHYDEEAAKLNQLLTTMPEEPDGNAEKWLFTLDFATFKTKVAPAVEQWLSEEPDYRFEDDYIDMDSSPEGSAYRFFQSLDQKELEELDISFVDGDRPGSNLCYAVLEGDIAQANAAAERTKRPFRFIRR
jgi:hypothetical protein